MARYKIFKTTSENPDRKKILGGGVNFRRKNNYSKQDARKKGVASIAKVKLYSAQAIAKLLNVSDRRVRQLRDEGIIEETLPGLYKLLETNHAYIDYLKGNAQIEENLSYYEERAKLVKAKRQNEELDLKIRKKDLHESSEIEEVMAEMLTNFKVRLMAIPAKLSPVLAGMNDRTKIYKLLQEAVEEGLNELSDFPTAFSLEIEEEGENGKESKEEDEEKENKN